MSLIGEITFINQNSHIPSIVASNYATREILHKEIENISQEDKEIELQKTRPVEDTSKVENEIEKKAKKHLDLRV